MSGSPVINLGEEQIEWDSGTRIESVSPYYTFHKTIYDPVINEDPIMIGFTTKQCHVTDCWCWVDVSAGVYFVFDVLWGTDISAAGNNLIPSGTTLTAAGITSKTIALGNIPKENIIWMNILARLGDIRSLTVVFKARNKQ